MQPFKEGCDRLNSIHLSSLPLLSSTATNSGWLLHAHLLSCIPVGSESSDPVAATQSWSFTNSIERTMWGHSRVASGLSNKLRFYHLILRPSMRQVLGTGQPGSLAVWLTFPLDSKAGRLC